LGLQTAFFRLITGAALMLALAACGGGESTTNNATDISSQDVSAQATTAPADSGGMTIPAALPTDANGNPLIASVNGEGILLRDYERLINRYEQQQFLGDQVAAMQAAVMGTLVEQKLINQAAAAAGVVITDAEIDAEIASNIEMAGGDVAWTQWLQENLYTVEEYRGIVRDTLTTLRMRDQVTAPLNGDVDQVRARHILLADEATALVVIGRLQAGDDFAALAAEYSLDMTTNTNGGDLGWFTREELLEQSLADLAFSVDPGTIVGPVQTMLGYHVLQPLERATRPVPDEKRALLAQTYFDNWLQSLVADAEIEFYIGS